MHFFLDHIGRFGLVFLLDAGLVIGCIFFLITLVVVALCSCGMPARSLNVFCLNHIGRCGLVFLLDVSLVIGCVFL